MMMDLSRHPMQACQRRAEAPQRFRVPLQLGELLLGRDTPNDDGFIATARRELVVRELGQAPDRTLVPIERGELRAVREVPDDDGPVAASRREPSVGKRC